MGIEQYRPYCGKPSEDNARAFVEFFKLPILPEEMHRLKNEWYKNGIGKHGAAPMKGADDITFFFRANGVPLAIATGGTGSENTAKFKGFPHMDRFTFIATGDNVSRNKPHPDIYMYACNRMGALPQYAVVFEDSEPGARAARDAGIGLVIGVPTKYTTRSEVEKVAHRTFGNLLSALAFIQKSLVNRAGGLLTLEIKA